MQKTAGGWKIFDAEMPIMTCEYSFGPGTATALAVGGEHGLIVVSPPWKADDALCDALSPYGPVVAIVASNAFHHLGLPEWKRRFPEAAVYAPAQSLARVERKTKIAGIRPLADAAGVAGHAVELVDMPHYKTGEVLVRMKSSRGLAWYVTDFMMNMTVLPANPAARSSACAPSSPVAVWASAGVANPAARSCASSPAPVASGRWASMSKRSKVAAFANARAEAASPATATAAGRADVAASRKARETGSSSTSRMFGFIASSLPLRMLSR